MTIKNQTARLSIAGIVVLFGLFTATAWPFCPYLSVPMRMVVMFFWIAASVILPMLWFARGKRPDVQPATPESGRPKLMI